MPQVHSLALVSALVLAPAFGDDGTSLPQLVSTHNIAAIRAQGAAVLPRLVQLYESANNEAFKARIAQTFYELSWQSPQAKQALMKDVHTQNQDLRLQVQWALGRVSNDPDVVETLLANMRNDANPLFRDKAACALTYDQIHLTEPQKVRLYGALIDALSDDKLDVRSIALMALQIRTGQNKGFNPGASRADRDQKVRLWQSWLAQYKSGL